MVNLLVLKKLLSVDQLFADLSILVEQRIVFSRESGLLPAREHDQVVELAQPLLLI